MKDLTDKLELDVANALGRFYSATHAAQEALAEELATAHVDFGAASAARAAQASANLAAMVAAFSGGGPANPLTAGPSAQPLDPHTLSEAPSNAHV